MKLGNRIEPKCDRVNHAAARKGCIVMPLIEARRVGDPRPFRVASSVLSDNCNTETMWAFSLDVDAVRVALTTGRKEA